MRRDRLLLTLDAFNTLYAPRTSIGAQYRAEAAKHGLARFFSADDADAAFGIAHRAMARQFPNYGRAAGMSCDAWWKGVRLLIWLLLPSVPCSRQQLCFPERGAGFAGQ